MEQEVIQNNEEEKKRDLKILYNKKDDVEIKQEVDLMDIEEKI